MQHEPQSELFTATIESLLGGKVICEISNDELFAYISNEIHRDDISHYLHRIGRILKTTSDGIGFYAAYNTLDDAETTLKVKHQFNEYINDLEPLVRWLRLTLSSDSSGTPLRAGDTIRYSDLLQAIDNAPTLEAELATISKSGSLMNNSTGARKQLESVLNKLCDKDYLVKTGTTGSVFTATARWSLLYEVLQFISTHEQIELEDESQLQQEMLN